jgi:hypothetical protein
MAREGNKVFITNLQGLFASAMRPWRFLSWGLEILGVNDGSVCKHSRNRKKSNCPV